MENENGKQGTDEALRELHALRTRGEITEEEFEARKAGLEGAKRQTARMSALAVTAFVLSFILGPIGSLVGIAAVIIVATSKGRLRGLGFGISAICVGVFFWGMLAAIAIPSFLNYMKRAKSTEARVDVERIAQGAAAYYEMGRALPASTDWTPATPCCQRQGEGKCRATEVANEWTTPAWQALGFAMSDDFRYQYRFVSDGATFSAEARGDLDCDGTTSLFSRTGAIAPDGTLQISVTTSENEPLE